MFALLQPLPAGNAIRLWLAPPSAATSWRVLRRASLPFTGPDDAGAELVLEGRQETALDTTALVNGVPYHYRVFYRIAGAWAEGDTATCTPEATAESVGADVQALVLERVKLGLAAEVKRGRLEPAENGKIQVFKAPYAVKENMKLPCVSVHVDVKASAQRAVGEQLAPLEKLPDGGWQDGHGWFSKVVLNVIGTSDNMDERAALRDALERILIANLPVFEDAGLLLIELQQKDAESSGEGAPLYFALTQFSCVAPSFVAAAVPEIADVEASATITGSQNHGQ